MVLYLSSLISHEKYNAFITASSGYSPMAASFDEEPGKMVAPAAASGEAGKKGRPKKG